MKWHQAGQLCFDQLEHFPRNLPVEYWQGAMDWEKRVQMLFADEMRLKSKIDAAMLEFVEQRKLPQPSAGIPNFLVCCRFWCAVDTVNILLVADDAHRIVPDPNGSTDQEILTWLLIETWNDWRWDGFLKLQAMRSLGGNGSFYSAPVLPNYTN